MKKKLLRFVGYYLLIGWALFASAAVHSWDKVRETETKVLVVAAIGVTVAWPLFVYEGWREGPHDKAPEPLLREIDT